MGRQIPVYEGPLSPEDYYHLKIRENTFAISENKRLYGEIGENWSEEQHEELRKMLNPQKEGLPQAWQKSEEDEEDEAAAVDDDDAEYVRNLPYEEVQRQIKRREGLDELPQGRDDELRNRLYVLVVEAHEDDELDDEEELDEN